MARLSDRATVTRIARRSFSSAFAAAGYNSASDTFVYCLTNASKN